MTSYDDVNFSKLAMGLNAIMFSTNMTFVCVSCITKQTLAGNIPKQILNDHLAVLHVSVQLVLFCLC